MRALAIIILISLFTASAYAEQRIVYDYQQAQWGGSAHFLQSDCESYCRRGENVNDYLSKGWRVVSTRAASIMQNPFKGGNSWCRCIGAEYILERQ